MLGEHFITSIIQNLILKRNASLLSTADYRSIKETSSSFDLWFFNKSVGIASIFQRETSGGKIRLVRFCRNHFSHIIEFCLPDAVLWKYLHIN